MRRRFLRDRMIMRDGRNPYGSRGGYVTSRRRDRAMDRMDRRDYTSERGRRMDRNYRSPEYRSKDYDYYDERYRESYRPSDYEFYGIGGMRRRDREYEDMDYYDYEEEDMEKEWEEDMEDWCGKLKKYDLFKLPKEEILRLAKEMEIKFDRDYTEKEFLTTYYMMMSDFPGIASTPQHYLAMAKDFLEDKDSEKTGGEKLCAYYDNIVKGW